MPNDKMSLKELRELTIKTVDNQLANNQSAPCGMLIPKGEQALKDHIKGCKKCKKENK